MKKSFTADEIVLVIEQAKNCERNNCDLFCERNAGNEGAIDERRRNCTLICGALNSILYDFGMLNY
jgi:hypothetical protein